MRMGTFLYRRVIRPLRQLLTVVFSLSRHLWNGLRGRGWKSDVQGQLPLHVSGEKCQWYEQCSPIPPSRPGGCHPVHLFAPVILFQCLCSLWRGETGHHEGKVLLQLYLPQNCGKMCQSYDIMKVSNYWCAWDTTLWWIETTSLRIK